MKNYRLLFIAAGFTAVVLLLKSLVHYLGYEFVRLGSLHTSVVAGVFFIISFQLSATIADYKESEKIPAEFSATVQNMYEDAATIHKAHPAFDFKAFRSKLLIILEAYKNDVQNRTRNAHKQVHKLNPAFVAMEQADVPPNFIVKLKQEQSTLTKNLLRVNYIQTITFIPSATILTRTIVTLVVGLLVFTDIDPMYAGLGLTAIITLMLTYILLLIALISIPFHADGETQDDVSLFLIDQTIDHIRSVRS
jgi:hypothetical protein